MNNYKCKTAQFKQKIDNALADVEDIKLIPDDAAKNAWAISHTKRQSIG